jgi:hypothetical protein
MAADRRHDILNAVRLRIVIAAVAATVAVAGLAGCRTNVGTAASVGGHRITESSVNDYITPAGADPSLAAQASQSNQSASPRSQVLQYLIQEQLFEKTLASVGQHPTAGQLAGYHDAAASLLLQTQLTGSNLDKAIKQGLPRSGVKASFVAKYLRVQELEYALIKSRKLTQFPQLTALIKKAKVPVSVSARYGTWAPSSLSLDGKAVVPSYLTEQPAPKAGGQAQATQPAG